jgi:hypothetical protein
MTTTPRYAARWAAAVAITAVLATGCGETSPDEAAPELARQLAQVDRAVTTGDAARIRERVESLESATETARDAGRLTDEQADRILSAADALLDQLPGQATSPAPSPPASPSPSITPTPEEDEGEGEGEEESKPEKPEPENDKPEKDKPDKPDKGKDKGKGKGH